MSAERKGIFSNADVDAEETIAEIDTEGFSRLWIQLLVGVANLTAFKVQFRLAGSGTPYFDVANAAGDFSAPLEEPIIACSGDLTTAAVGATPHWLCLNVQGVKFVRLRAAGANTTISGVYSKG